MIGERKRLDDDFEELENISPSQDKKPAVCQYCHFQFKANYATHTPKKCPYCGRNFFMDD